VASFYFTRARRSSTPDARHSEATSHYVATQVGNPYHSRMATPESRPATRAIARVYRLGSEPGDDLSACTTPEERVAMVAILSRRMWELTGRPVPTYSRREMPV